MEVKDKIAKLLDSVSAIKEIRAIGQTGEMNAALKAGESDVDIFLMGDKIPGYEERKAVYDTNSTPVGRCSTLKNINVIYDESGVFGSLKEKLSTYPDELKKKMLDFHMSRIKDEEDFGRALLRKDVLFYHQVLEAAIDHYLQALYAANETFFPSRKRTKQYIDSFRLKPENCYRRLLEVIKSGSNPDGIAESYHEWCKLVDDLQDIWRSLPKGKGLS